MLKTTSTPAGEHPLHGLLHADHAEAAALAADLVEHGHLDAVCLQDVDQSRLDRLEVARRVGRDDADRPAVQIALLDEVQRQPGQLVLGGGIQRDQSVLAAPHELRRHGAPRYESGLVSVHDAQGARAGEAAGAQHDHRVVILGRLDAGGVALLVHRVTRHRDLEGVHLDQAAPHTAALLVHHRRERVEHLGHIADGGGEAVGDQILETRADVRQRDRVGPDAGVGGHPVRGGVVGVAEGVELHERVVAAVHGGLELVEDAVAGIVVDVRRRSLRLRLSLRPRGRSTQTPAPRPRALTPPCRFRQCRSQVQPCRLRAPTRSRGPLRRVQTRSRRAQTPRSGAPVPRPGLGVGHRRGVRHLSPACRGHQGRAHQHPQQPMLS